MGEPINVNKSVPKDSDIINLKILSRLSLNIKRQIGDRAMIGRPLKIQWFKHLAKTITCNGILLVKYTS